MTRWLRTACPNCSPRCHRTRDDARAVNVATGRWSCWRCRASGVDAAMRSTVLPCSPDPERARAQACRIFAEARPITAGDPVDLYLRGRSLRPAAGGWPVDLRSHPRLRHPSCAYLPAMVAIVRDVASRPVAVARTWLTTDGRKADVHPVRATLGASQCGSVQLGGVAPAVALAEGIEDALAVALLAPGWPCWATLGEAGMRRVSLPSLARRVVLVPDRDDVGASAARELADRLRREGRTVEIRWPRRKDAAADLEAMGVHDAP
jgi:putative DNA primase/helicase